MNAPFQYFGGKGLLASKIIQYLPKSHIYAEPFCGAASIFWAKEPSKIEALNDIDGQVINLFRVLQNSGLNKKLFEKIYYTPYSVDELAKALTMADAGDDIERAWSFYVLHNQGFAGKTNSIGSWGREFKHEVNQASNWDNKKDFFHRWLKRLRWVQLDNKDCIKFIKYWDRKETVFYLDPPYVFHTRKSGGYSYEFTDNNHLELLEYLTRLKGQFVLSGYDSEMYNKVLSKICTRVEFQVFASSAGSTRNSGTLGIGGQKDHKRKEVLWIKKNQSLKLKLNLKLK